MRILALSGLIKGSFSFAYVKEKQNCWGNKIWVFCFKTTPFSRYVFKWQGNIEWVPIKLFAVKFSGPSVLDHSQLQEEEDTRCKKEH